MSLPPKFLTWDGDPENNIPPRRPSTDDVGGADKEDDLEFPPDPQLHPTADGWNQKALQIPAMARVTASLKLELRYDGTSPYLARVTGPRSSLAPDQFTVDEVSEGVVEVTWPANFLPPHQCAPTGLTLLSDSTSPTAGHVMEITNGIRVRTFEAGSVARVPFAIAIN